MNAKELEKHQHRLYSRTPLIGGWLRHGAAQALARDGSRQAVQALAEAVTRSDDEQVRTIAMGALRKINTPARIDAAVAVWAVTRHPDLTALLVEHGWVASAPVALQVLSTLKVGRADAVVAGGADVVEPLVQAAEDADPTIATGAKQALRQLNRAEARDALCRLVTEQDRTVARQAALEAGYVPCDEVQRALFFFLTEQWERYEGLDFDRRLLRVAYDAADDTLRRRIMEKMRAAGRTDFLTVVAGGDYHSRAALMTPGESEFLVQMLTADRQWARLWLLVFELPLEWSARIVQTLARNGWKPDNGDELAIFQELASLASAEMITADGQGDPRVIARALPPAVQRAEARVPGRINDVAFSPLRPIIAIGTGQRKVVLWNFQRAERERVVNDFAHSIGRVVFMPDDVLLCAERTNSKETCAIHGWRNSSSFCLGQYNGSVTALEPINGSQVLTTERGQRVTVWDVGTGSKVTEQRFDFWARAARVSPDGKQAALLHDGVTIVTLPELAVLAHTRVARREGEPAGTGGWPWSRPGASDASDSPSFGSSVSRCAAFAPGGEALIVGTFSGEVFACARDRRGLKPAKQPLARHSGQVRATEVLPGRSLVITAGADGSIQFTAWADRASVGSVQLPGGRLTSLRVSPDEAFMAVGDSEASMSLWDLRVLDVPALLTRPLAQALPTHLAAMGALAGNGALPARVQNTIRFAECVLRHRFRYDIEIDDVPTIQPGEFDIEIEG